MAVNKGKGRDNEKENRPGVVGERAADRRFDVGGSRRLPVQQWNAAVGHEVL